MPESLLSFTLSGPPRTKKNHNRLFRGRLLPSKAFAEWNDSAQMQLAGVRGRVPVSLLPIHSEVNCRAVFYRQANVGDAVGFYQALGDALEEGRIVVNDRQIVSWDGSRILKDAANPRVEVTLSRPPSQPEGSPVGTGSRMGAASAQHRPVSEIPNASARTSR